MIVMVLVITTGNEDNPIYLGQIIASSAEVTPSGEFGNFSKMLSIFDPNCQKSKKSDKDFLRMKESKGECVIQHNDPPMMDSYKLPQKKRYWFLEPSFGWETIPSSYSRIYRIN